MHKRLAAKAFVAALSICGMLGTIAAERDPAESRSSERATLEIRDLRIPPSTLWSREFREFYERQASAASTGSPTQPPARHASKAEWDEFDRKYDRNFQSLLAQAQHRYPVTVADTQMAGIHVGIISPGSGVDPKNRFRVLINLHGGYFVYNRGLTFGLLESIPVAALGRIRVVTIDYRQAPQFSYPAASEDVEAVYKELLKQYKPTSIGIFGCSAGGALAAQATARFHLKGMSRPGAVGIFCYAPPTTPRLWDMGGDSSIWTMGTPKSTLSEADRAALEPTEWYMEGADAGDAAAYPGSSDAVLRSFPPTLFLTGTRDFAMSAAIAAHARLLKLGVDSSLYIMEGGPHAAHIAAASTPEAEDAQAYVAHWFQQHLAP